MKAFFADIKESGLISDRGATAWGTKFALPTEAQTRALQELDQQLEVTRAGLKRLTDELAADVPKWEERIREDHAAGKLAWKFQRTLSATSTGGAVLKIFNDEPVDFNYYLNGSLASERKPGGGLIGLRAVESQVGADRLYLGVAEVLEAMNIMFAADVWGDIPYSEAVGSNTTPKFDGQLQVYASLLTLLDKAIADLGAGGTGPGPADLVYGGSATKWAEAAHTLKARIYLHQVEKSGNAQYTSALAEARKGISSPANDWKTAHSSNTSERNMWAQFAQTSFGPDLVAGSALVNLMKAQNDPRIGSYYQKNSTGAYVGYDVSTGTPDVATISALVSNPTAGQPIITYDETQLIIAEAALQTSDRTSAATAFNLVRTRAGKPTIAAATLTLADVMNEKYITLFENPEVWNDYKRTCLPALKAARGKSRIPGRIFYGQTEEQTNSNTPTTASQNLFTYRNANDPNGCQ
jgi:hypothetical protein